MMKYLLILLALMPITAQAWEYPEVTQELPYEDGMGTQEDPFVIKSAQQLANLAYYVNNGSNYAGMYFKLGNDIDLNPGFIFNPDDEKSYADAKSWVPIGMTKDFKGNFDGNGHVIKGLLFTGENTVKYNALKTIQEGLFGTIRDMTLSNLEISNSLMTYDLKNSDSNGISSGFFAAISMNCNFIGLKNKGNAIIDLNDDVKYYGLAVAGIVTEVNLYESRKDPTTLMKNCVNYGSIKIQGEEKEGFMTSYLQGFGGILVEGSYVCLEDCHNYGNIDSKGIFDCGGIGTIVSNFDVAGASEFKNLTNSGVINMGSGLFVRGMGSALVESYNEGDIHNGCGLMNDCQFLRLENCYNTGNVYDELGRGVNGSSGLVGYSDYLGVMKGCYNTGNVTANQAAGGLIGCAGPDHVDLIDCYNEGDIAGDCAGGLIGTTYGASLTIKGCTNSGSVSAGTGCGGLIGFSQIIKISNSANQGNINGESKIGGIVGYADELSMNNVFNTGDIIGKKDKDGRSYVGGLIGYSGGLEALIVEDCHNSGNVQAEGEYVGGIAGRCIAVSKCYNTGDIRGGSKVGGISGNISNRGIGISNCYNVGKVIGEDFVAGLCPGLYGGAEYSFNYGELDCQSENKALLWILETQDSYNVKACIVRPQDGWDKEREEFYYNNTKVIDNEGIVICSDEEFEDGTVCVILNGNQIPTPWGQTIGKDSYPLLNGIGNPDDAGIVKLPYDYVSDIWFLSDMEGVVVKKLETDKPLLLLKNQPKGLYLLSSAKNGAFKVLCK